MIIIDNFVQDQILIDEIIHDKTFFGPNGNFMWWDGWWNSGANTVKKRLIEYHYDYLGKELITIFAQSKIPVFINSSLKS